MMGKMELFVRTGPISCLSWIFKFLHLLTLKKYFAPSVTSQSALILKNKM